MARDTGFPHTDAQFDFSRMRRRRALARLAQRLRGQPADVGVILPYEEVIEALGYRGERYIGLETIAIDSVVGTVDRGRSFDRRFRPTSRSERQRWERMAEAQRRGEAMPPIDVYRIGDVHFVKDGHHRVSVARALGHTLIDAYVTEVQTAVGAGREIKLGDLPVKSHERLFLERVPLSAKARERISFSDPPRGYSSLAEGVEAWGFRVLQACREPLTREVIAQAWFRDEYEPVVEMLREADLIGRKGTEADAYLRVAEDRYLLLRTHSWDESVIERLRRELR